MRPQTIHALAQLIRHTRGCVTTIEKWIVDTPPEMVAEECAAVIFMVRGALMDLNTTLSAAPYDVPAPAPTTTTPDRPAVVAARSSPQGD